MHGTTALILNANAKNWQSFHVVLQRMAKKCTRFVTLVIYCINILFGDFNVPGVVVVCLTSLKTLALDPCYVIFCELTFCYSDSRFEHGTASRVSGIYQNTTTEL